MLENIFSIIIIGFISLIPIVVWGYIFSYIDSSKLSRKRFVVGLIGGAISVIPILFLEKLLESSGFNFLNIFEKITQTSSLLGAFEFNISLTLFLFILAGVAFIAISWTDRSKKTLRIYLKNILIFSGIISVLTVFILLFGITGVGAQSIQNGNHFGEIAFDTVKLVIFYYILIAFIEEASKHFNFLQSSILHIKNIQQGVLYAIFVALGFAFIENILYFHTLYSTGGLTMELSSIYFYRSIFSVMLHILCSSIVGYSFSKAHLQYTAKRLNFAYIRTLSLGLFIAVFLHLLFDLSLTFGLTFMIIVYFIGGYLYVSSIFYKE